MNEEAIVNWRSSQGWAKVYGKVKRTLFSMAIFKLINRLLIIFAALSIPYWLLIASDRYVSQATVIIQRTDKVNGPSAVVPAAAAVAVGGSSADQLLLREYLLSEDMLDKLDAAFDLRSHYSNWHRDPISRMCKSGGTSNTSSGLSHHVGYFLSQPFMHCAGAESLFHALSGLSLLYVCLKSVTS